MRRGVDYFDDIAADLSVDAPPALTAALRTTIDDAGVRTLRYCESVVGHYQRAKTHRLDGPLWRGVTHAGAIVYGRTETAVRAKLLEMYA
jgi:hypothetical protein